MEHSEHVFTKKQLIEILNKVIDKTLGEVDSNNVFDRTILNPKITGIAGDVIEQSVLGYPADTKQNPDLYVDGEDIELKTTGIRKPKKDNGNDFEAKEPMSITAVSPEKIVNETFKDSNFWHKLEKMLLIYYHYDSEVTVKASEYANFYIKGYHFHEFDMENQEKLENDWEIVRNFIAELQSEYENPADQYSRISSELRPKLMLIDTAPKWPNRPRFRLKRATVSTIVQKYFGKKFEKLDQSFSSFYEIDKKLNEFTEKYKGITIKELINQLNISVKLNEKGDVSKSITEQIVTRMFGAKSKKISKIEDFSEVGLVAKTVTQTLTKMRTEDTKLFKVNFDEWVDENLEFENSTVFSQFSERQFLFIIFEEQKKNDLLLNNKFLGFKRFLFSEDFIENEVKRTWNEVRYLITEKKLIETNCCDKNGVPIYNKNGVMKTAINFPKSQDYKVFFRGTGRDSSDKPIEINGIQMYRQDVWIKGCLLIDMLKESEFI